MLFLFPELKLCGFRWFSANLAAKVDGIKPVLWQAFHLGLMVSSVTLAKTSSAFWRAGPLVKVTNTYRLACLQAAGKGKCNRRFVITDRFERLVERKSEKLFCVCFLFQLGRHRLWKIFVLLSMWLMIAAKAKHAIFQCQSFDCI